MKRARRKNLAEKVLRKVGAVALLLLFALWFTPQPCVAETENLMCDSGFEDGYNPGAFPECTCDDPTHCWRDDHTLEAGSVQDGNHRRTGYYSLHSCEFTHIPPWGSTEDLEGQACVSNPEDYKVAVYIKVGCLWWSKPYENAPYTAINPDGSFVCDITTGGSDASALEIVAYVIPADYDSPLLLGVVEIPSEIDDQAFCKMSATREFQARTIQFSGYEWWIKNAPEAAGPGPNYFSDAEDMVWVDAGGKLHLKIAEEDGKLLCSEVVCGQSFGYGDYTWKIDSRVDTLDPNIVVGLFTWDDYAPDNNYGELDIEFSQFGIPGNGNSQFVVQYWDVDHILGPYLHENLYRCDSDQSDVVELTAVTQWRADSVHFMIYQGHGPFSSDDQPFCEWTYAGTQVPIEGEENPRINFWLYNSAFYGNVKETELVVSGFEYQEPGGEETGSLAGAVYTKVTGQKEPIIGATVTILKDGTAAGSVATDANGHFELDLSPDLYCVLIEKEGFKEILIEEVEVQLDMQTELVMAPLLFDGCDVDGDSRWSMADILYGLRRLAGF